jgi:hypothetical protein
MERRKALPPAFRRFARVGGVLDFTVFGDADGGEDQALAAVATAFRKDESFNGPLLRTFGSRRLKERAFFGDWYDCDTGSLIKNGTWRTADGRELQNPRLVKLDRITITSGGGGIPDAGSGGQFAYAFSSPPYSLRARPKEVQALFSDIRDFILPPAETCEILDWTTPQLPQVSRYFAAGMDWWGVFLFTVHAPETRRLTVIAGSTTD